MDIVKVQLLDEGWYSDLQEQIQFDDAVIEQCHLGALRAWDKVEEPRKRPTSFTKIVQSSGKAFTDFLQRLVSAVNKAIIRPCHKTGVDREPCIWNVYAECKRVIRQLKARAETFNKWIKDTIINTGSHETHANITGQAIAKGLQYQNDQCFNCRKFSHLQRACDQATKSLGSKNAQCVNCEKIQYFLPEKRRSNF